MKNILTLALLCSLPFAVHAQPLTAEVRGGGRAPELPAFASQTDAVAEPLSAAEYRGRVMEYSLSLKQSGEQVEAVRQAMREAKTSFLPALDFGATGQYRVTDYNLDFGGATIGMRPESYSADLNLQQVVYAGGAVKHGYKAAELQHKIALKGEELTTVNVIYAAAMSYWGAAAKSALYRLTDHYVAIIEEQTQVIRERFHDGLISKTDLLQIESRLSAAKIQRSEAHKSFQLALQNLNILMGADPLHPVRLSDEINLPDAIPSSLISLDAALDRRAEFAISELNVDYQARQLKIQRSKYLPQLAVGMKAGWGTTMLNFDGSTMWNSYVFASLQVPLFRFGAKCKNTASQRALLRSREFEVQQTRDQVSQELHAAFTNLRAYSNQIGIAEESCAITKESLELNTFSYNEGKLPIIDVLSAQVSWVQANSALIQAWLQEKVAFVDYNKAIGSVK